MVSFSEYICYIWLYAIQEASPFDMEESLLIIPIFRDDPLALDRLFPAES